MATQAPKHKIISNEEFFSRLQGQEFEMYRDIVRAVNHLGHNSEPDYIAYPLFNPQAYTDWADKQGWIQRTPEGKYVVLVQTR